MTFLKNCLATFSVHGVQWSRVLTVLKVVKSAEIVSNVYGQGKLRRGARLRRLRLTGYKLKLSGDAIFGK